MMNFSSFNSSSTSSCIWKRDRQRRYCSIILCTCCIVIYLVGFKQRVINIDVDYAEDTTIKTTTETSLQLVVNYDDDDDDDDEDDLNENHPQKSGTRGFNTDHGSNGNNKSAICSSSSSSSSSTTQLRPLPRQLDFLHVPKTGTSFKRLLVQYLCNTTTEEDVEKIFTLVSDAKWIWDTPMSRPGCARSISLGHHPLNISTTTSTTHPTTATTTLFGTSRKGVSLPLDGYVTLLRRPIYRIASGFVHVFHDCRYYLKNKYTVVTTPTTTSKTMDPLDKEAESSSSSSSSYPMKPYCDEARNYLNSIIIDNDDDAEKKKKKELYEYIPAITTRSRTKRTSSSSSSSSSNNDRIHIVDLVVEYAQCAKGCTLDLLSGIPCGDNFRKNQTNNDNSNYNYDARMMDVAKERLSNFGFVGLTDEWKAMGCSFQEMFTPRIYGGNYLHNYFVDEEEHNDDDNSTSSSEMPNTRPSLSKSCENDIITILKLVDSDDESTVTTTTNIKWKERDDPDYELYLYGKELFECNFLSDKCRRFYSG